MSGWQKAEIKPYRQLLEQLKEIRDMVVQERNKLAREEDPDQRKILTTAMNQNESVERL